MPGLPLQLFSEQGYFVFMPNPRGSYGQGEEFTRANVQDFGHGDLEDILAGVDAVVKSYPVDDKRVGIGGWSYGGYMTMWTVTQTHRFRAAFAGAGIANWQSYYGENGIDQWMIPYFGASVYDDPAVYAKSSPINFIKNVQTPTLVMVGDRDAECPPPQSYEFWHALKTLGVKTEFVLYPGEGHGFHDPQHIRDRFERVLRWFNENMPARRTATVRESVAVRADGDGGAFSQFLDDVAHFLRAGAVGDQQRVGGIDDHQILHAQQRDQLAFGVHVIARTGARQSFARKTLPFSSRRQQLVDRVPASDIVPAEIVGGEADHMRRFLEHRVIDRDVLAVRERLLQLRGEVAIGECRAGWRAASRSSGRYSRSASSSTDVFQKNIPAFQ